MARQLHTLSARTVATLTKPGRHSDGGGLYLNITASGARSWVFMWKTDGKRREMGLGSLRDVPLAKARERAAEARQKLADGLDPIAARDNKPRVMTFGEAADALIESMSSSWRNEKHRAQWKMTLTVYCEPLRAKPVTEIGTEDVLKVLTASMDRQARDSLTTYEDALSGCSILLAPGGKERARTRPGGGDTWTPFCRSGRSSREDTTKPCRLMWCPRSLRLCGSGMALPHGRWSSPFSRQPGPVKCSEPRGRSSTLRLGSGPSLRLV